MFTRSRSKEEHTRKRSCNGTHALSTIGATESPKKCARVHELIEIDHTEYTETYEADGMFCGRDGLSSALSRNIDDEDTQWEPSPFNGACASVKQYTSSMSPMDNEDRNNEGVNIPERISLLQSLDSRLDEVAREMATDTRRSERTSSGALLNSNMLEDFFSPGDERDSDCESGSHKSDSSSSGDSDVVDDFQGYLGDECQGCNAGTPEIYPLPTPITTNRASQRTNVGIYRGCRICVERFTKA